MQETTLIILILGVSIGIVIFLFMFAVAVDTVQLKRYEHKYPKVFILIDEIDKLSNEFCRFYNENIVPIKRKIDCILERQKYMSSTKLANSNIELEQLKIKMEELEIESDKMQQAENKLRERIETIIKIDTKFLKFMKRRGWCQNEEEK